MIRLAQAASSECYSAWGEPPNQRRTKGKLDGELNVVPFYGGWEICFRPINPNLGERIANFMLQAVKNGDFIGYGQNNGKYPRTGVFDALMKLSTPDPMQITTLCNCDCSSLVGAAVYFSGVNMIALRTMYTGTERDIFRVSGEFVEITDKTLLQSGQGIRKGDVLLKAGHTAVSLDTDKAQETTPCFIWNCKACNLREGAGTEYKVMMTLSGGEKIDRLSTAPNGWVQVKAHGRIGFVSPKYIKEMQTMKATGNVWLRKDAGTKNAEIIVIPLGATVYATGATKKIGLTTWYNVVYASKEGWASGKYLTRS